MVEAALPLIALLEKRRAKGLCFAVIRLTMEDEKSLCRFPPPLPA